MKYTIYIYLFIYFLQRDLDLMNFFNFFEQPDRPDERERVEAAGGNVINWDGFRVLGVLSISRSIGIFRV